MTTFGRFIKAAGLLGGGSVVLAILLFLITIIEHIRDHNVEVFYLVLLAAVFFCFGAYQAWHDENRKYLAIASEKENIERKYFDERPRLGLSVHSIEGPKAWMEHGVPVTFEIQHLGGRVPTSVRFDPIPSKQGKFLLQFDSIAHVDPPHVKAMNWDVIEVGVPLLSAKDREKTASLKKDMLLLFLKDTPSLLADLEYPLVVNFTDGEQLRTQYFHLTFETSKYRFSTNTA